MSLQPNQLYYILSLLISLVTSRGLHHTSRMSTMTAANSPTGFAIFFDPSGFLRTCVSVDSH